MTDDGDDNELKVGATPAEHVGPVLIAFLTQLLNGVLRTGEETTVMM